MLELGVDLSNSEKVWFSIGFHWYIFVSDWADHINKKSYYQHCKCIVGDLESLLCIYEVMFNPIALGGITSVKYKPTDWAMFNLG